MMTGSLAPKLDVILKLLKFLITRGTPLKINGWNKVWKIMFAFYMGDWCVGFMFIFQGGMQLIQMI